MLRRLPFLLVAAALLTTTSAAAAPMARVALPIGEEGQRTTQFATFGPALAGDAVVFGVSGGAEGGRPHLLAAPTVGGPARELPGAWSWFRGGDAGVLARVATTDGGGSDRYDPSYIASETLTAGPVDGPAETLSSCIAPTDADGARVAYVAGEHCDEVVVRDVLAGREVARWPVAAATTPIGEITAPEHCARPVLERTLLGVDRRGRTTVALRCPAACSGTLTLTGMVSEGYLYRRLAQRPFSLPAGRHRIAVAIAAADRVWLAHGKDRARPAHRER